MAISDLAAEQSGNDVVLTCTVPSETVEHNSLGQAPAFEIYRSIRPVPAGSATSSASSASAAPTLLATIPSAMVSTYTTGARFRYVDALTAGDFAPGGQQSVATYVLRTRAAADKDSADSNRVQVDVYPAPNPVADLRAQVMQSGIDLTWTAPQTTLTGSAPSIAGYHIYRAEAPTPTTAAAAAAANAETSNAPGAPNAIAASAAPSASAPASPQLTSPFVEVGQATSGEYRDGDAQKDKTYVYSVRSAIQAGGKSIESADSNLITITLRDIFPPGAPTQLIATGVPAEAGTGPHIDLSWAINPETDLAGYNVYRSEQADASGTRINSNLLPTPAFSDMNAVPGESYFYKVTAVDRTGNESPASSVVEAAVPAGNQATP